MLIRKMACVAASYALVAMAFGAASASATTIEAATTGVLASGTLVANSASDPSVLSISGLGTITCTNTTSGMTVGASGGATVNGTLDTFALQTCTDTIPLITISGCDKWGVAAIAFAGFGNVGGTIGAALIYLICRVSGGTSACYYSMSPTGTYTNATRALVYTGVSVTHSVPTGGTGDLGSLCGSTGSFSTTLTNLNTPPSGNLVSLTG